MVDSIIHEAKLSGLSRMVIPAGVEPAIFWMRTRRPRPLDDGTNTLIIASWRHVVNLVPNFAPQVR